MGDEPYSPGRTDSQSLGGHGDQESWSSDQTNTANCPATQTTTPTGIRQPRSQKEAKLLSHFHHLRQQSEQLGDWKFIVDQIGKNTTSKVTVSTLLQRIIYLGLNLSGITSITAAVA